MLKNKGFYVWTFRALRAGLIVHLVCAVIFKPLPNLPDTLIQSYVIMPFYTIVVAPIVEEVAYRKIIFGFLSEKYNFWVGASVSSALFSLGHFSPDRLVTYFLVGMLFCHYYKKSGSIGTTIFAHSALNFISLVMLTVKS
ncbi:CPBP family intramembrane glutamic endopeptidase [Paenibacillus thalictri]|uniref:CPBP family intramembrane glutamic endopeptidase n=1 Tax=Paenibacillus thalictri TaxID=2527873 RepID=UPI001033C68C|nr:CPBP family intramembrane glutamic endopeptidase [Paenibacillus thalictri]